MGTLIVSEFVTLDGVMEAPGGEPAVDTRTFRSEVRVDTYNPA